MCFVLKRPSLRGAQGPQLILALVGITTFTDTHGTHVKNQRTKENLVYPGMLHPETELSDLTHPLLLSLISTMQLTTYLHSVYIVWASGVSRGHKAYSRSPGDKTQGQYTYLVCAWVWDQSLNHTPEHTGCVQATYKHTILYKGPECPKI